MNTNRPKIAETEDTDSLQTTIALFQDALRFRVCV